MTKKLVKLVRDTGNGHAIQVKLIILEIKSFLSYMRILSEQFVVYHFNLFIALFYFASFIKKVFVLILF